MHVTGAYDNVILFTNGAIGDFLMAGLCADSVSNILQKSDITIITPRNTSLLRELFSAYPHIKIREVNRRNFLHASTLLARMAWKKNLVINQGVFKKIPFFVWLLARLLVVHPGSVHLHFLQKAPQGKSKKEGVVVFDYHLSVYENLVHLVRAHGIEISPAVPLYRFVAITDIFERYGLTRDSYVVIHPCASSFARSLPTSRWVNIFQYITHHFPETKIVVTGSIQDDVFIQTIFNAGVSPDSIVTLAGKLSMGELANIIDGSRGYVGVDTGITHLAGVLQKQSVVIGNLSNPCWLPFYNKNATILTERKNCTCDGQKGGNCLYQIGGERYYKCMIDIPEESIYEGVRKMLV